MAGAEQKSVRVSRNGPGVPDARALATRQRLDQGFVELLMRRAYDDLRVAEIAKKAGVGRSTFYAHYKSKDELLRSQFRRIVTPMMLATGDPARPLDCTRLFAHILVAQALFHSLMRGADGSKVIRECCAEHLRRLMKRGMKVRADVPKTMMVGFVVHGLMAVLEFATMREGTAKPEELQEMFQRLVGERVSV
jgi:AcrR family transcriptional regulator